MTQQDHANPSDMASVVKETRKTRKALKDMEYRMESRIHELKEQARKTKEQQDQTTRNIQSALAFTFFVVIASHFLFYPSLVMKNMDTKMETTELKEEAVSEPDILTAIVGSWKIVSSDGMDQFVQRWKSALTVEPFEEEIYRFGIHHVEFDNKTATLTYSESFGTKKDDTELYTLGKPNEMTGYSVTTFVDGNKLVTVAECREDGQYFRRELFVKDGKLHIVTKRWGLTCTRIYEKLDQKEAERLKEQLEEPEKTMNEKICTLFEKLLNFVRTVITALLKALCDD